VALDLIPQHDANGDLVVDQLDFDYVLDIMNGILAGDIISPEQYDRADWNGDGVATIGVFRNGAWFLDADGNGWIDSGDTAYADLRLWQLADDGTSSVESLIDAGIGALATASAETPFTIKENGEAVAQVRASSVWLGEHSGAGIVRQIDVAVTPRHTQSA